jgi:nucleoid-associated protein YgaU
VQRDLAAARAQIADQNPTPVVTQSTPATTPSTSDSTSPGPGERTYIVKPGDTLRGIAEKVYGDVTLVDLITQANHITDPTLVHQGTKLIIPPKP